MAIANKSDGDYIIANYTSVKEAYIECYNIHDWLQSNFFNLSVIRFYYPYSLMLDGVVIINK